MQSSLNRDRKRGAGAVAAALLIGGSMLGARLATAAGRSQPRAVTFPSYTATAINDATDTPTALNVNTSGAVAGYLYPGGSGPFTAFLRTGATLTRLPGLGTGDTIAINLNNAGDAVGESKSSTTARPHAVLWRSSDRQHPVDLSSALGAAEGESHALAINDAGDIVGVIGARGGSGSAFFLSHTGTLTVIGPGEAQAINNAATPQVGVTQSTGAEQQAGIWDATNGFQPAPFPHSTALRLNDQGILLGRSSSAGTGGQQDIRFIWSVGQPAVHRLNLTAAGFFGGISNGASPTVVTNDVNGPVLWKDDTVTPLRSLLANANQVDVDTATGINDSGKISATGFSGSWLFSPGTATHVDLQATLTADPSTVSLPTSTVNFTVSIKNFGPDAATGVQVTPVINGVTAPAVPVPGSIASGSTFASNFQIKPADFGVTSGTFIITASVTSDGIEPDPDTTHRNSSSTTVTVSGGTTSLTLQAVTVTPNPVQVPKPASVVLTFSGNIPTTGVNVTLQVTDVPVIGTYTKEFTGIHADAGKPKQATLTFDTSQLASVTTAPIQVHANAIYNGVTTNGPTVTINPAGPPPVTLKLKSVKLPKSVDAPEKIHVTATLTGKATSETTVPVHLVVGVLNTEYSLKVPAGAASGSLDIATDDFVLAGQNVSARVTASLGGVTSPNLPSGATNVTIFPLYLESKGITTTVVPPSTSVPGGELKVVLAFTGAIPAGGVDVRFNGLFLNNKTVHVNPDQPGSDKGTVHLSTSEVIGTISGTITATFHIDQPNQQTITSKKITIKSATPPPPLALAGASITPSTITHSTAATSVKLSLTFNQVPTGTSVTVPLTITGPLPIPVNVSVKLKPVAGKTAYEITGDKITNFGTLISQAPAGTYTVKASYGGVDQTATFTVQ